VLDEAGKPVANATVEPYGFMKEKSGQFGGLRGFDELALTNDKGEFRLSVPEAGLQVHVRVHAPFYCPLSAGGLTSGLKGNDLTLSAGVTLVGRLVKDGKPLAGRAVGTVQKDRNVDRFVGVFQAATDANGLFTLPHVPPNDVLVLYGLMDSLGKDGAVASREVKTGASGKTMDLGDLEVKPGYTLSGRVVLADGKAVPAGSRVLLSREEAWDSQQVVAGNDGEFRFEWLPPERYSLSANVPGCRKRMPVITC
jgi:hypothetical protein